MSKLILERPTGIIRTLPSLYGDASVGARRYKESIEQLERGELDQVYIALPAIPTKEVLYLYLLVNGHIDVRLNIAGYIPGCEAESWDTTIINPKFWAICTGPVSRPPEKLARRGFQGFRYTEDLW